MELTTYQPSQLTKDELPEHEVVRNFPLPSFEDKSVIRSSIERFGVRQPLSVFVDNDGRRWLIDGRTRRDIACELKVSAPVEIIDESALGELTLDDYAFLRNASRRQLTKVQRAIAVAETAIRIAARRRNGHESDELSGKSIDIAKEMMPKVAHGYVRAAIQVLHSKRQNVIRALRSEVVRPDQAAYLAKLTDEQASKLLAPRGNVKGRAKNESIRRAVDDAMKRAKRSARRRKTNSRPSRPSKPTHRNGKPKKVSNVHDAHAVVTRCCTLLSQIHSSLDALCESVSLAIPHRELLERISELEETLDRCVPIECSACEGKKDPPLDCVCGGKGWLTTKDERKQRQDQVRETKRRSA